MIRRILPTLVLSICLAAVAHADVIYDESDDGPLSNDPSNPTMLTTNVPGPGKVIASTQFNPFAADFMTVTIPDGFMLDELIWGLYDTTEDRSFFAVEAGTQITSVTSPDFLLGSTFITAGDVATNVLDDLGMANLGGSGFNGRLGPGDYTFWFQETAADVDYGFTFVVTPIPEPTSAWLLIGLGAGWLRRKR